ncbi:MAG TPA: hypothetical protein VL728_19205 [Cyclobacteriaceae bacterium]|jgi:hypothetical protein|nr:hypothetical protein [Cyclobacteriaceae bacterium]
MKKLLILTKTNWNEAPRIRHQITRLLKSKGFAITFIERNSYKNIFICQRREEGIQFYSHAELIHHQLRYFYPIQWANNLVVKFYLRKILKRVEFDLVFNFCYDYSFLRTLAPSKKIITMVEDDFESQAKFGMTKAIRDQVRRTCKNSDVVLTVSYPLFRKLREYNPNVRMFFPWSQKKYATPTPNGNRNVVLYFGYVHRMEWPTVERLVKETEYTYRFIGPTAKMKDDHMIAHLKSFSNFEYIPYSSINQLKIDDVFCSILPYDPTIKSVQSCTVSNRAFNLLSLGLPLAYADLHELIEAPSTVITKNKTVDDYKKTLEQFHKNFYAAQSDIESFLNNHYEDDRWRILNEIINNEDPTK